MKIRDVAWLIGLLAVSMLLWIAVFSGLKTGTLRARGGVSVSAKEAPIAFGVLMVLYVLMATLFLALAVIMAVLVFTGKSIL